MKKTLVALAAVVDMFGFVSLSPDASADLLVEETSNDAVELRKVKDPDGHEVDCGGNTINDCWRDCNDGVAAEAGDPNKCQGINENDAGCCTKHNGKVYRPCTKKRPCKKKQRRTKRSK